MADSKVRDHRAITITSTIPRDDTLPGPGLQELNGKVEDIDPRNLLGEDE